MSEKALAVMASARKLPVSASDALLSPLLDAFPEFVGGSVSGAPPLQKKDTPSSGRCGSLINFGFGREHCAASCCVGLAAFGGFVPFWRCPASEMCNAWGAIRLSALSRFRVLHIATYDGEDIQDFVTLCRATPNLALFCPCDAEEVAGAYASALGCETRPSVIVMPAPGGAAQPGSDAAGVAKGAYVIADFPEGLTPQAVILASGADIAECLAVRQKLISASIGVRVVSLVSWVLFDEQPNEYRQSVLDKPRHKQATKHAAVQPVRRVYVDSGAPFGVQKYADRCVAGGDKESLCDRIETSVLEIAKS
eukprot:TRINITY_DN8925_c0_g1_i3.p2 TRINITY_DN8925_c0_g1~~TRINITY_DN8925_c0_g1_i3.p2  ORF type:complete len:309 (+),score=41.46 TRINITY_DN8925_c0_g1_i3:1086-2012(+)